MSYFEALILGILQGVTEFLPISSSGHLVLLEHFLNLKIAESTLKGFDVILHFGTLLAIILYFKGDILKILKGVKAAIQTKTCNTDAYLFRNIILATIPILIVGFFFNDFLDENFRNPKMVALMLLITGVLLLFSEKFPRQKTEKIISLKKALIIGVVQSLALIPGISRSGSTIAIGMFQGVTRETAARFSFLIAIPAISAAVAYVCLQAILGKIVFPANTILLLGFLASFISSYLCVSFLMHFIRKYPLSFFSWYLFLVSGILFFL